MMNLKTSSLILAYIAVWILTLVIVGYGLWSSYAFYKYPCEAFKTGYLSLVYAPGRCVK